MIAGVAALSSSLTIADVTKAADFDFVAADAGSTWVSRSGSITLTRDGAAWAALKCETGEAACRQAGFSHYSKAASDWNPGTKDVVLETVARVPASGAGTLLTKLPYGPSGLAMSFSGGKILVSLQPDGLGYVLTWSDALTPGSLIHAICFLDRSGSGQWYVNGSASGAAVSLASVVADVSVSSSLGIGLWPEAGDYPLQSDIAVVRAWTGAAWLDTHLQATVAAARFAALVGGAAAVRARALAGSPSAIGRVARTYSLPGLVADCDCTVSEPAPGGGGLWSHPTDQPRLAPDGLRATIARTNLLTASVPTWTATNATVTANTLDAWGVSEGQRVRETTADGKHNVVITAAGCTPGAQHSLSVVLKHTAGRAVRVLGGFSDDIAFYNGTSWVPFVDPGES
jgi:hypothetical protein